MIDGNIQVNGEGLNAGNDAALGNVAQIEVTRVERLEFLLFNLRV